MSSLSSLISSRMGSSEHGSSNAATGTTTSSAPKSKPKPKAKNPYPKFTHTQIRDKVEKRANIPEYYTLLMGAAIREDAEGVTFDSTHPSWTLLLKRVQQADEEERKRAESASSPSPSSTSSSPLSPPSSSPSSAPVMSTTSARSSSSTTTTTSSSNSSSNGSGSGSGSILSARTVVSPRSGRTRIVSTEVKTMPASPPSSSIPSTSTSTSTSSSSPSPSPSPSPPLASPLSASVDDGYDWINVNAEGEELFKSKEVEVEEDPTLLDEAWENKEWNPEQQIALDQLLSVLSSKPADGSAADYAARTKQVREACRVLGGVHPAHRAQIWEILLECESPSSHAHSLPLPSHHDPSEHLANQRVIRADILRTLPHLPRLADDQVRAEMEIMLTHYCKELQVSYKQGMNYILAPFVLVADEVHSHAERQRIYHCFVAFINRFLRNTFNDNEFGALQMLFALFRFLILYHDPELCQYLDNCELGPELYANSWFITLYANRVKPDVLLYLWDLLILESDSDALLHYFVSLALLISHRETVLEESMVNLPETLSHITIRSRKEALDLFTKAKVQYRGQSSQSLRQLLASVTARKISIDSPEYQSLSSMPCLTVSAEEIIHHCYEGATAGGIKFFILDCRPLAQYEAGHLPCAYHLDPALLLRPDKLGKLVESLNSMKGCHFCFLDQGGSAAASRAHSSTMLNLYFLQRGFKYVSNCEGGFERCHELISRQNKGYELIDHHPSKCVECLGLKRRLRLAAKSKQHQHKSASMDALLRRTLNRDKDREKDGESPGEDDGNGEAGGGGGDGAHKTGAKASRTATLGRSVLGLRIEASPSHSGPASSKSSSSSEKADKLSSSSSSSSGSGGSGSTSGGAGGFLSSVKQRLTGLVTGEGRGEMRLSDEYKAVNVPDSTVTLAPTVQLRLLHTILRSRHAKGKPLAACINRIAALVAAAAFERVDLHEVDVTTSSGGLYTGLNSVPVCAVSLSKSGELALRSALKPLQPVINPHVGRIAFETISPAASFSSHDPSPASPYSSSSSSSSSSFSSPSSSSRPPAPTHMVMTLPDDIASRHVLLYVPVLAPPHLMLPVDVSECINELLKRGVTAPNLTVLTLIAARPVLWTLAERYPDVCVVTSTVDEYMNGIMVPGVRNLEDKYFDASSPISSSSTSTSSSSSSSAISTPPSFSSMDKQRLQLRVDANAEMEGGKESEEGEEVKDANVEDFLSASDSPLQSSRNAHVGVIGSGSGAIASKSHSSSSSSSNNSSRGSGGKGSSGSRTKAV